jgi:hypothetical protein
MTTDVPVPSTSPQTIAFQRAAELVALADSVGINRNQIQALIAARLAEWQDADLLNAAEIAAPIEGRTPVATIRSLIWENCEVCDHGPGRTWKEYSEVLQQDIDALEASIQRAREYICVDICKGEIGGGEDAVGNLIAICNGIRSQRDTAMEVVSALHKQLDGAKRASLLGEQLLERAKECCSNERIDEWSEEVLQKAQQLGVGGVKLVAYDPTKHGLIDCESGDMIWTWDSQPPQTPAS